MCSFFESFELIIFVYAVDDNASFEKVKAFVNTYQEKNLKIGTLLVGNKIDLVDTRTVSRKTGENYAKENGMLYFEISAETETCFSEVFFEPFISKFLAEKKMEEKSLLLDDKHNVNNSISLNTSFSNECCSCCPCLKQSENLDSVSYGT
jgi:GTPase SAR1 family protein